ncbi:calcium-binding protein [Maribius pontilimi]|uniref:Calcium-binding protein n=1 Tax=Palleronia pontilimi TaxID=1964209 RepID=A0A934MCM9_9RHOB|nr:EF-hand domain-containing protein [Palleronia pontilimi]MBJ3761431.1 calcium-binding protein [Palleronia pontilimi]
MNRPVLAALAAALVTGLAAPVAMAAGEHRGKADRIRMLDLNGDGQITRDEAQTAISARFAAADTDGNGALSQAEMTARAQARAAERVAQRFARLDADGDGQLTESELPGPRGDRIERLFDRVDANGDDVLSADELQSMRARHSR